jgi:hypothetical protein
MSPRELRLVTTTVIKTRRGRRRQPNEIYVGRPSKWGNPFEIGVDGTRDEVVARHRAWLPSQPQLLADLHELRGKTLLCWCAPLACHADTLAELADALP